MPNDADLQKRRMNKGLDFRQNSISTDLGANQNYHNWAYILYHLDELWLKDHLLAMK